MRTYDVVMRGGRVADSTGGRHVDDVGIAGANVAPDPPLIHAGQLRRVPPHPRTVRRPYSRAHVGPLVDRLLGLCERILSDIGGAEELEVAYLLARRLGAPARDHRRDLRPRGRHARALAGLTARLQAPDTPADGTQG